MKFHFPFAAGRAVSAPAAASTAADGGMIDVTAGQNEEDGDHRHHSIDSGIHSCLLFMYSREVKNENKGNTDSGLDHRARRPLITCERGSAGSTGSKGVVRRIKK